MLQAIMKIFKVIFLINLIKKNLKVTEQYQISIVS